MSEYPPPYQPAGPAPKKSSNTALILFVVLGGLALICGGMGYAIYVAISGTAKMITPMMGCMFGYESVYQSINEYAKANDGKYPPAATWQTDVRPFYAQIYQREGNKVPFIDLMKPDGDWGCDLGDGKKTGIAYNSDIAGKKMDSFKNKSEVVMIYEIPTVASNVSKPYKVPTEPAPTHMMRMGWFSVTLDGDMKGLSKEKRSEIKFDRSSGEDSSDF